MFHSYVNVYQRVLEIPSNSSYVMITIEILALRESNTNDLHEIGIYVFESATHPRFSLPKKLLTLLQNNSKDWTSLDFALPITPQIPR